MKKCQVWNCESNAVFINPESKFVYCNRHAQKLGFKIIHESKRIPPLITRLVHITKYNQQ